MHFTNLESELLKYFGYSNFRGHQKKIISKILNGNNVVGVLPTGSGKSICFQLSAALLPNTTLVISPLTALMNDQILNLPADICGATLHSGLTNEEKQRNLDLIYSGRAKIIYLSPETALSKRGQRVLSSIKVSLFVVDEAHCINSWGYYFRPAYDQIGQIKKLCSGKFPTLILTASTNLSQLKKIVGSLELNQPKIFHQSVFRNNLKIKRVSANNWSNKLSIATQIVQASKTGVIFSATQDGCIYLSRWLAAKNIRVAPFFADLPAEQKQQTLSDFKQGLLQTVVATSAFGMGIDLPNINYTIHFHPAYSIEDYYQQIGRAGRDGSIAHCYFLDLNRDKSKMKKMILASDYASTIKIQTFNKFLEFENFQATKKCYFKYLSEYFSESKTINCGQCSNCIS